MLDSFATSACSETPRFSWIQSRNHAGSIHNDTKARIRNTKGGQTNRRVGVSSSLCVCVCLFVFVFLFFSFLDTNRSFVVAMINVIVTTTRRARNGRLNRRSFPFVCVPCLLFEISSIQFNSMHAKFIWVCWFVPVGLMRRNAVSGWMIGPFE